MQWKSLTQNLKRVLDGLPSPDEKEESIKAINELVSVLENLGKAFGAMPTVDEASRAKESLAQLENIVSRNPVLRGGSNGETTKPRPRASNGSKPSKTVPSYPEQVVAQTITDLDKMPENAMRSELEDAKHFTNSYLRAVLSHLGRSVSSKSVRSEMVDQLVSTLVNRRTYRGLSGEKW